MGWGNSQLVHTVAKHKLPLVGKRYMIKIATETLSDDVRALITAEAPRKSVSKDADGFVVGTFDNYDEPKLLMSQIVEKTDAEVEIIEFELNE